MSRRRLACIALVCLVALPPLAVGAAENRSARWEKDIQAFEAADRVKPPPSGGVLFIGSSTIRMWKSLPKDFPDAAVVNRGFGGCEIADCTYYADRIAIPYKPRMVVLRAGSNDLHAGKTPEQVHADFQAFVAKLRGALPDVRIVYMPINATPARCANVEREKKADALIRETIAKGANMAFVDVWGATMGPDGKPREELFLKDRLHFNAEGYKILAAAVRPHLKPARP